MKKMIDRYTHWLYNSEPFFFAGFETFCYQNCQRLLLGTQGIKCPEIYINSALSLDFHLGSNEIISGKNCRSLLPSYLGSVKRFYYESADASEIFNENIKYMVENDSPVIVGIDSYYLPYASNYMKNHARHTLILCGYDLEKSEVNVIDWYPPWFYKGKVPMESFISGRQSGNPYDGTLFSGKNIGNNWAYIERIEQKPPQNLLQELFSTVKENYYDDKNEADVYHGINAIVKIREHVNMLQDAEAFTKLYKKLNVATKRYKLFKQCLECYLQWNTHEGLSECVENAERVIKEWDIVIMLILKTGRLKNEKNVQRLNSKIDELIDAEIKLKDIIFAIS